MCFLDITFFVHLVRKSFFNLVWEKNFLCRNENDQNIFSIPLNSYSNILNKYSVHSSFFQHHFSFLTQFNNTIFMGFFQSKQSTMTLAHFFFPWIHCKQLLNENIILKIVDKKYQQGVLDILPLAIAFSYSIM